MSHSMSPRRFYYICDERKQLISEQKTDKMRNVIKHMMEAYYKHISNTINTRGILTSGCLGIVLPDVIVWLIELNG